MFRPQNIKWDYNSSAPFPINPVVGASAAFGPVTNEYNGSAGYRGNQGVAWISARRVEPAFSGAALTHQNYVDLDIRTGLAYVDGNLALSRPIDNSFLMVKGVKGNRNCDIKVDPNLAGYDAYSRPWLPAVQPSLQPYFVKKVRLEAINPPIGAAEEKTDFTLYPTYKSAYVLYLGSEATVIAYGTLLLGPGRPVGYQALKAVSLDDAKREPVTGFTNGEGKFQLPRLKPGRYRIDLQVEGTEKSVVFRIAEDASGIIPLGEIRVP